MIIKMKKIYIFLGLLVLFLCFEIPVVTIGQTAKPEKADVIIILGAKLIGYDPSTLLKHRLDKAITLYKEGYAGYIIVSGAQGQDEVTSEAASMRDYLVKNGVPSECILLEDRSFNTYQNLLNSQTLMKEHGLHKALIVSNASHIRRALVLASSLDMEASAAPAPMAGNLFLDTKQYIREGAAMFTLAFWGNTHR